MQIFLWMEKVHDCDLIAINQLCCKLVYMTIDIQFFAGNFFIVRFLLREY